jgi:hypothetical protein
MDGNFDSVSFDGSIGGFDTDAGPAPAVGVGGGAGRPIYRRRKWREVRNVIEDGLQAVYEDMLDANLPRDVMGEAVKLVKPFADKAARFKAQPKAAEVDWMAMQRDAELARQLIDIHTRYIADVAWARMMEEEDEILLLN